jgi:hypothetical protein
MKIKIAAPMLLTALAIPAFATDYVESYRQVLTGYQVTYNYNGRNTTVVLPYDPGPRVPIEVGVTGSAAQPAYVGPPVARITYEQRPAPIWEQKPYKRPRPDRDWDR